jgi:hypothetical protein
VALHEASLNKAQKYFGFPHCNALLSSLKLQSSFDRWEKLTAGSRGALLVLLEVR